jgi:lysyl-tRNA synthetase class 1
VPAPESSIKFSMLLNLVSACNAEDKSVLWGFLKRELPNATPAGCPMLDKLCGYAVRYYHDFVKPTKKYRAPTELERTALAELREYLTTLAEGSSADDIMTRIYDLGLKYYSKETMREWFKAMYETLLGSAQGPRMGSFIALFGASLECCLISVLEFSCRNRATQKTCFFCGNLAPRRKLIHDRTLAFARDIRSSWPYKVNSNL